MAVTVQRQCASAVTAMSQDALVGSAMANGTTLILVALRPHACQAAWGTQARRCRRQAPDAVARQALSTCHPPIP